MLFTNEQKKIIEAALYVAGEAGLTSEDFCILLDINKELAKNIMDEIITTYQNDENSPFVVKILENKYKLLTKPELNATLMKLAKIRHKNPLTRSLMEVLTIIAYNAPITKKEIEKIKPGFKKIKFEAELSDSSSAVNIESSCDYALRRLRELELIEGIEMQEVSGKPLAYRTTKKFLDVFGLKNLKELPKVKNQLNWKE